MKDQIINIHNNATINAVGKFNSKHTKAVICKETGTIYSSITDAAKGAGVTYAMVWGNLNGKYKSVKGKHYEYLDNILDNPDDVFVQLRKTSAELKQAKAENASLAEDARKWREYQAEQERIRREEERRLEAERRAEEDRQNRIAKLTKRLERRKATEEQAIARAEKATARRKETEDELAALLGENT